MGYEREIASAQRLIAAKGCSIDIVTFVDPAPEDPSKPWDLGPPTEVVETTKGVFLSSKVKEEGESADNRNDDELVHKEQRRILVAAGGLTKAPNVKGEIRVGGVRWSVKSVVPVSPGGTDILYTIQVVR